MTSSAPMFDREIKLLKILMELEQKDEKKIVEPALKYIDNFRQDRYEQIHVSLDVFNALKLSARKLLQRRGRWHNHDLQRCILFFQLFLFNQFQHLFSLKIKRYVLFYAIYLTFSAAA